MAIFFLVSSIVGWLLGIWLPWWAIICVLLIVIYIGNKTGFGEGLSAIPIAIATSIMCLLMVIVGFATGNVTFMQLFGFTKILFTGS